MCPPLLCLLARESTAGSKSSAGWDESHLASSVTDGNG